MIKMEINGKIEFLRDKWDFARQVEKNMGREAAEYLLSLTKVVVEEEDIQSIFYEVVSNMTRQFEGELRDYITERQEKNW